MHTNSLYYIHSYKQTNKHNAEQNGKKGHMTKVPFQTGLE